MTAASRRRFVLASASPARRRLLAAAGIAAEVIVSGVDESEITATPVESLAAALAAAKAETVAATLGDAVVLGCDSLLDLDGTAHGRPVDAADAVARWARIAGATGVLHTGHSLLDVRAGEITGRCTRTASTTVHFGRPTEREVAAYIGTGEPLQVAGAFTLDGYGGWWVDAIEGDHGTVLGLSLPLLRSMLAGFGLSPIDFWAP